MLRVGVALAGLVGNGLTDRAVDGQAEDVVAAVVAGDVEGSARRCDAARFDLGEKQPVLLMERDGNDLPARRQHARERQQ